MAMTQHTIFKNAYQNKFENNSIFKRDKNKPIDNYGNTLLHIATEHENLKYVKFLLYNNYDTNKQNKFGKSAWDIALNTKNKKIIDEFVNFFVHKNTKKLENINDKLKKYNTNILNQIEQLTLSEKELKSKNNKLESSISICKFNESEYKLNILRLTNDKNFLHNSNKKIKEENQQLNDANKNLKISIDTLINANMK